MALDKGDKGDKKDVQTAAVVLPPPLRPFSLGGGRALPLCCSCSSRFKHVYLFINFSLSHTALTCSKSWPCLFILLHILHVQTGRQFNLQEKELNTRENRCKLSIKTNIRRLFLENTSTGLCRSWWGRINLRGICGFCRRLRHRWHALWERLRITKTVFFEIKKKLDQLHRMITS